MANTSTKSKSTKTIKKTTEKPVAETVVTEVKDTTPAETPERVVKTELDPNTMVTVKNGFQGRLIYVSRHTGEKFIWEEFGDEQDIELKELKQAKGSSKSFFVNNWFMIDDWEVLESLGVTQYYENALSMEGFDEIFEMSPDNIRAIVGNMSDGQKKSLEYKARDLYREDGIDSLSVIKALEESLSIELIEK